MIPAERRLAALLMTLLLALSAFPLALADEEAPRFTDVPAGAYYEEAVKWCAEKGITSGKTAEIFAPDETCTRAQIVTFLYRAAGAPMPTSEITFTDVAPDAYYYDALRWAVEQGIANGFSPERFYASATVKRAQVAAFLWRASLSQNG